VTVEALPPGSHLIHIGPQKTGSTALQWALHHARDELRRHGVVYPGPGPRIREAAEFGLGFRRDDGQEASERAWRRLLRQIAKAPRLACISHEAFGRADDDQIRAIVEKLGGERPHVVAVARRYDSLMPSQWQQRVKAKVTLSYDEWLRTVLSADGHDHPSWRNLWVPHDTVTLLERWAEVTGSDNITLIVGDERRRDLVPQTIEQLLGVPSGTIDLGTVPQANTSMSYPQVELLRQLNLAFKRHGWSGADYHALVRRGVVLTLLNSPRSPDEPRLPPLPRWARDRLVELSDRRIDGLRGLPVRIVGDLENLRVSPVDAPEDIGPPVEQVSMSTVALALEGMARGVIESRGDA
jgi:hypothetical protein